MTFVFSSCEVEFHFEDLEFLKELSPIVH